MTSTSHKSGTDRSLEALKKSEQLFGEKYDVVINIQGDEPFVSSEQLEKIKSCFSDETTQIATLVKRFSDDEDIFNPNSPKVVLSSSGNALYFSRSVVPYLRSEQQDSWQQHHIYYKHIGLYGYRSDVLSEISALPQSTLELAESLEQLRWLEAGFAIKTSETTTQSHAIDTPEDLEMVRECYRDSFSDVY